MRKKQRDCQYLVMRKLCFINEAMSHREVNTFAFGNADVEKCCRFPKDPEIKQKWADFVNLCNRTIDYEAPTSRAGGFVCSAHFKPHERMTKKLVRNAVPTIAPK